MSDGALANLGMYDPPWLRGANDALWAALGRRLRAAGIADVPDELEREPSLRAIWGHARLLLGQTCGYPLVTELGGTVAVVGRPTYALPGCRAGFHRSLVVVRAKAPFRGLEDLRGSRAALNGRDSNTGMNLLRRAVAPFARNGRVFGAVVETGAHLASLAAVAAGGADAAAIDCVTFGLAARHRPDLTEGVRILAQTPESPTLPFITAGGTSPERIAILRRALAETIADPANTGTCAALGLAGIEPAAVEDYAVLLRYEAEAAELGYPVLA
ncbi:phosphate/phosphite/phosphonate ABC transporter substrate-binding protein [Antarcticirhabdus aurantiaca]|uniref:PhnD/SsuA/transferrin family substrate-binding protein n=1 Tax=Antarcticirhabdus aurantiaca TaxID=2606717 RepID=A0ACD4NQ10_9HYPH|nr:PhnD/SsuA/transferrin family substrate-binding protein [Antarcticirhabdus aurantiaca]WAJ28781.1 PhnD/SsuA/transferrin family substrate-binding protein [Jeongeuplla avenae]